MNDNIDRSRRPRRAWLRLPRTLAAMAGIAVLATACSSSSSSTAANPSSTLSAKYEKALAYSRCMRSHGVPDFPDPNSNGTFTVTPGSSAPAEGNVSPVTKASALNACRHLLPNGGSVSPAQQQASANQALRFAACMRAHGLRNFPDPSGGGTRITIPSGMNPQSPQFQSAQRACQSLAPVPPGNSGS